MKRTLRTDRPKYEIHAHSGERVFFRDGRGVNLISSRGLNGAGVMSRVLRTSVQLITSDLMRSVRHEAESTVGLFVLGRDRASPHPLNRPLSSRSIELYHLPEQSASLLPAR